VTIRIPRTSYNLYTISQILVLVLGMENGMRTATPSQLCVHLIYFV
jgi:hypothetical protein